MFAAPPQDREHMGVPSAGFGILAIDSWNNPDTNIYCVPDTRSARFLAGNIDFKCIAAIILASALFNSFSSISHDFFVALIVFSILPALSLICSLMSASSLLTGWVGGRTWVIGAVCSICQTPQTGHSGAQADRRIARSDISEYYWDGL